MGAQRNLVYLGLRGMAVNSRQHVELIPGLAPDQDRLDHIALETDNAEALRRYLASRGVEVPERVTRDPASIHFTVPSPTGRRELERTELASGARVSDHILHLGIIVGDGPPA